MYDGKHVRERSVLRNVLCIIYCKVVGGSSSGNIGNSIYRRVLGRWLRGWLAERGVEVFMYSTLQIDREVDRTRCSESRRRA